MWFFKLFEPLAGPYRLLAFLCFEQPEILGANRRPAAILVIISQTQAKGHIFICPLPIPNLEHRFAVPSFLRLTSKSATSQSGPAGIMNALDQLPDHESYYRKIYELAGLPYPGDLLEYGDNRIEYRRIEEENLSTTKLRAEPIKFLEDIPGEIRNHIYRCAFLSDGLVNGIDTKFSTIGLLMTSKKAHEEASSILYGENGFTFGMEIDWTNKPEIQLCGFPPIGIWPAKTYHRHLKKLHVKILLRAGGHEHLSPPEIYPKQLQTFREAYDSAWQDLDMTYEFVQLPVLTFTTAWIKLRLFEPLAHPSCKIQLAPESYNPELTIWILETVLHKTDVCTVLSPAQRHAFNNCRSMAQDIYRHKYRYMIIEDFVERITHGDHAFSGPWMPPISNEGLILGGPDPEIEKETSSGQALMTTLYGPQSNIFTVIPGVPMPPNVTQVFATLPSLLGAAPPATKANHVRSLRRNHTDTSIVQRKIRDKYGYRNNHEALALLMQDNELRICASLAFPKHAKGILIEGDWGLKTSIMVLECEGRAEAAQESIALELGKRVGK